MSEGGVQVELQVVVLDGTIGTNITLSVTTNDRTAIGMGNHVQHFRGRVQLMTLTQLGRLLLLE